jgi:hypothetical protein
MKDNRSVTLLAVLVVPDLVGPKDVRGGIIWPHFRGDWP